MKKIFILSVILSATVLIAWSFSGNVRAAGCTLDVSSGPYTTESSVRFFARMNDCYPQNPSATYNIDFGDGTNGLMSFSRVTYVNADPHTYTVAGNYTAVMTLPNGETFSNTITVSPAGPPPVASMNLNLDPSCDDRNRDRGMVDASWSSVVGATTYKIIADGGVAYEGGATSNLFRNLDLDHTYPANKVEAYNGSGVLIGKSSDYAVTTPTLAQCTAYTPQGFSGDVYGSNYTTSDLRLRLYWSPNTDFVTAKYNIYKSSRFGFSKIAEVDQLVSYYYYDDYNVGVGDRVSYRIEAEDIFGRRSSYNEFDYSIDSFVSSCVASRLIGTDIIYCPLPPRGTPLNHFECRYSECPSGFVRDSFTTRGGVGGPCTDRSGGVQPIYRCVPRTPVGGGTGDLHLDARIVGSNCGAVRGGSLAGNGVPNNAVSFGFSSPGGYGPLNPGTYAADPGNYAVNSAVISNTGFVSVNCPAGNSNNINPGSVNLSSGESETITAYFKPKPTFTISPAFSTVLVGGKASFMAWYDSDGPGGGAASQNVTNSAQASWTSSDDSIAALTAVKGEYQGVRSGSVTARASYSGIDATALLNVNAADDFVLNINPGTQSVERPGVASYIIGLVKIGNFNEGVNLSVLPSSLPGDSTSNINPSSISVGETATLTVGVSDATPIGAKTITVRGNSASLSHTVQADVNVLEGEGSPLPPGESGKTVDLKINGRDSLTGANAVVVPYNNWSDLNVSWTSSGTSECEAVDLEGGIFNWGGVLRKINQHLSGNYLERAHHQYLEEGRTYNFKIRCQ